MLLTDLCLQLFTVRENFKTEQQSRETFKKLRELGYTQAQTAGCYGYDYGDFYAMAHDAGIEIVGTHDSFTQMVQDFETSLKNHQKLHTTNMGIGGFVPENAKQVEEFIAQANKVAALAAQHGMKFTYHNHSQEFWLLDNGRRTMDMLIEGLDPKNTSFVLDTYWIQYAGGCVCEWIRKLKGRIDILHLKDMRVSRHADAPSFRPEICACGRGNLNFTDIIKTAKECGVTYFCVEQDNCPVDFVEDVGFSAQHLLGL